MYYGVRYGKQCHAQKHCPKEQWELFHNQPVKTFDRFGKRHLSALLPFTSIVVTMLARYHLYYLANQCHKCFVR